jgi:predicted Zn-dependent protease
VNGLPAAYATARVNTQSGAVDLTVFAYRWDSNTAYHFAMITPAGSGLGPFAPMVQSLTRISAAQAAAIRPRVIDVVTVGPRDSVASLAGRMAYNDHKEERFRVLNGLASNAALQPGQKVKIVVFGARA